MSHNFFIVWLFSIGMIQISELLLRFLVGGFLIMLVSVVGQTRYRVISGLIVLFPIVTVVGFYFLSFEVTHVQLRSTILFSILAIPTVLAFLITFYYSVEYFSVNVSVIMSVISWFVVAIIIFLVNQYYIGLGGF